MKVPRATRQQYACRAPVGTSEVAQLADGIAAPQRSSPVPETEVKIKLVLAVSFVQANRPQFGAKRLEGRVRQKVRGANTGKARPHSLYGHRKLLRASKPHQADEDIPVRGQMSGAA